jgi:HEAT repeat protein
MNDSGKTALIVTPRAQLVAYYHYFLNPYWELKMNNVKKLGSSGIYELLQKEGPTGLIEIVEDSPNNSDIKFAIRVLGEIKCPEAVEPVIHSLFNPLLSVKSVSVWALGEIADPKAVKPLVSMLKDTLVEPSLRVDLLQALAKIDNPKATEAIVDVFCKESSEMSESAFDVLKGMGSKVTKSILTIMNDVNPGKRQSLVKILAKAGDEETIQTLLTMLQDSQEPIEIREEATVGLAKIKNGFDLDYVLRFVELPTPPGDNTFTLRCWLITLLGETGNFGVTKTLVRLLQNKHNETRIRYHAAHALGRLGDVTAAPALLSVLNDPKDNISHEAAAALFAMDETKTARSLIKYLKRKPEFMDGYKLMSPDGLLQP